MASVSQNTFTDCLMNVKVLFKEKSDTFRKITVNQRDIILTVIFQINQVVESIERSAQHLSNLFWRVFYIAKIRKSNTTILKFFCYYILDVIKS